VNFQNEDGGKQLRANLAFVVLFLEVALGWRSMELLGIERRVSPFPLPSFPVFDWHLENTGRGDDG